MMRFFDLPQRIILSILLMLSLISPKILAADIHSNRQFSIIPEKIWNERSKKSYKKIIRQAKRNHLLVIDPKLQRIMQKIIPHAQHISLNSAKMEWEIHAYLHGNLNAYAFAGGKILVNTGLYWQLDLTEDELAFVIAHEMAHALLDHSREKMSASLLLGSVPSYLSEGVSQTWLHEKEADLMAVQLMNKAGIGPQAAASFFEKLSRETERRRHIQAKQPLMSNDFMQYRLNAIGTELL